MFTDIRPIPKCLAEPLIMSTHYSRVMPRINKFFIGGFNDQQLVGVMTLGWGTRPLHTIKVIFPTLSTRDYLELGKLCLDESCPRNSESQFISKSIKIIKKYFPKVKILFSWADGILGKPGYVYQASNFYYGGFIWSEMYLDVDGNRIHPRTFQGISPGEKIGKHKSRALSVTNSMGLKKYYGKQFRYVYPLCGKREWEELIKTSPFDWKRGEYPKSVDCKWKMRDGEGKKDCEAPPWMKTEKPRYTKKGKRIKAQGLLQL